MQFVTPCCVRKNYTILFVICKEISTLQPLKNYTAVKSIYLLNNKLCFIEIEHLE